MPDTNVTSELRYRLCFIIFLIMITYYYVMSCELNSGTMKQALPIRRKSGNKQAAKIFQKHYMHLQLMIIFKIFCLLNGAVNTVMVIIGVKHFAVSHYITKATITIKVFRVQDVDIRVI